MKVKVGDPVPVRYQDEYVAELRFMHGDADGYSLEERTLDEEGVLALARFMKAYVALPHNVRCCNHGKVRALPGYWRVFTSAYSREELFSDSFPGEEYWPRDVAYGDSYASIDSQAIYYYSDTGIKHYITIEEEEEDA